MAMTLRMETCPVCDPRITLKRILAADAPSEAELNEERKANQARENMQE